MNNDSFLGLPLRTALTGLFLVSAAQAQLVTSWNASSFDDGNPIPNFVGTWISDVTTGAITDSPVNTAAQALAADNEAGLLYGSSGSSLATYTVDANGDLYRIGTPTRIHDTSGVPAESRQVNALAFGNGELYASVGRSIRDEQRNRGIPGGFYSIDPTTAVATMIVSQDSFQLFSGFDFNPDDGLIYGVTGPGNAQSIVKFNVATRVIMPVADVPASAYAGATVAFNGVAVGDGKVYLTEGLSTRAGGDVPIAVFDIATSTFDAGLPSPFRSAENRAYGAGAAFFDFENETGTPGTFVTSGVGCPLPDSPAISLEGAPAIGNLPVVAVEPIPADSVGATLLIGFTATDVPLDGIGAPGCSLFVSDGVSGLMNNLPSLGRASRSLILPFDPSLVGVALELQAVLLAPSANSLGVALSDRGTLTIGS